MRKILYILFNLILFIFALGTGQSIFYIAALTLFIVFVLNLLAHLWNCLTFDFKQELSADTAIRGETVSLDILLRNRTLFPITMVQLEYNTVNTFVSGEKGEIITWAPPLTAVRVNCMIGCEYRGIYNVGVSRVILYDILGMFPIKLRLNSLLPLKVYPRAYDIKNLNLPVQTGEGAFALPQSAPDYSADLSYIRSFQRGDTLRHVHWKLSARKRELQTKIFEQPLGPQLCLLLNCNDHNKRFDKGARINNMLAECCASIIKYALNSWQPVNLIAHTDKPLTVSGNEPVHLSRFLSLLASIPFDSRYPLKDIFLLNIKKFTHIVLVTAMVDNDLFDNLMALRLSGTLLTVYMVVDDGERTESFDRLLGELVNLGVDVVLLSPTDSIPERLGS